MKTFSQYDARDMLRLSKDEMVQMIGMVDGVSVEDNHGLHVDIQSNHHRCGCIMIST